MTIEVKDSEVIQAVNRLAQAAVSPTPALKAIGEMLLEQTGEAFSSSRDPWGVPWAPNSPVTLARYLLSRSGTVGKKTGQITAKGQKLLSGKKPLFGESQALSKSFHYAVSANDIWFGSNIIYAAMQHFGGKRVQFPNLWGDIPARRILPIDDQGQLAPKASNGIVEIVNEYLAMHGAG